MERDTSPGSLYWDNHMGQYILCVETRTGIEKVVTYPYYSLEQGWEDTRVLTIQERVEVYSMNDEDNPLERQCCIEYLGRVAKNQMLQHEPDTLLSDSPVRVHVPDRFINSLI